MSYPKGTGRTRYQYTTPYIPRTPSNGKAIKYLNSNPQNPYAKAIITSLREEIKERESAIVSPEGKVEYRRLELANELLCRVMENPKENIPLLAGFSSMYSNLNGLSKTVQYGMELFDDHDIVEELLEMIDIDNIIYALSNKYSYNKLNSLLHNIFSKKFWSDHKPEQNKRMLYSELQQKRKKAFNLFFPTIPYELIQTTSTLDTYFDDLFFPYTDEFFFKEKQIGSKSKKHVFSNNPEWGFPQYMNINTITKYKQIFEDTVKNGIYVSSSNNLFFLSYNPHNHVIALYQKYADQKMFFHTCYHLSNPENFRESFLKNFTKKQLLLFFKKLDKFGIQKLLEDPLTPYYPEAILSVFNFEKDDDND